MSDSSPPNVSLIIPAYNEEPRIAASLEQIKTFVLNSAFSIEIILVIEKSTDRSLEIAKTFEGQIPGLKIIANSVQRGKGYAVQTGTLASKGELVFFTDLDLSTPLDEVIRFKKIFDLYPTLDILLGSRQHPKSKVLKRQNPLRQKMGQTFNLLLQLFVLRGIKDTQCGFKGFRRKVISPLFLNLDIFHFAFDVEIILKAHHAQMKMQIVPVQWINSEDTKVRIIHDSLKMLRNILDLKKISKKPFFSLSIVIQAEHEQISGLFVPEPLSKHQFLSHHLKTDAQTNTL